MDASDSMSLIADSSRKAHMNNVPRDPAISLDVVEGLKFQQEAINRHDSMTCNDALEIKRCSCIFHHRIGVPYERLSIGANLECLAHPMRK